MVPAHHNAVDYIEDYLDAAGLWDLPGAPLFQSVRPRRRLSGRQMMRQKASVCREPPVATPSAPPRSPPRY